MTPKNDNYEHNLYYTQHKWLPHFFYGATAPLMKEIQEQKGQLFVDLSMPCMRTNQIITVRLLLQILRLLLI